MSREIKTDTYSGTDRRSTNKILWWILGVLQAQLQQIDRQLIELSNKLPTSTGISPNGEKKEVVESKQ